MPEFGHGNLLIILTLAMMAQQYWNDLADQKGALMFRDREGLVAQTLNMVIEELVHKAV
jgi:hypothetical protein